MQIVDTVYTYFKPSENALNVLFPIHLVGTMIRFGCEEASGNSPHRKTMYHMFLVYTLKSQAWSPDFNFST